MQEIVIINRREGEALALMTALQHAGYRVLHAPSVETALYQLDGHQPALVLLGATDQHPFNETTLLRSHPVTSHVPVLLQSDNFSAYNADYLRWLGAEAAVSHLASASRLLDCIATLLQRTFR